MKKYIPFLITACFALLYLGSIWFRPLYIPDETRYAEIPREMIASGDFIVPKLNGLHYFEKPVLGYWMNAGSQLLFGETPGSVRFMGALCTLLSAGLLWLLCRRAGEEKIGRVAAVVFLLSGLVFAVGTYGVLDAHLSFFVMLTMTAFYYAYTEKNFWKQAGYLAIAGVGVGLAFMTKGLLAFVLPAIAIGPFLLWQREWKRLFTLPWIPLVVALLVLAPWALAVHRADPDFWHQFIGVEHFQRFSSGQGANDDRSQPFWFFIPMLLVGLLPWTFFLPAVWFGYRGKVREFFQMPLLRYAACIGAVWFVLFSLSSGKLATYILPCFPAYAIMLAVGLIRYAETRKEYRAADWVFKILFRTLLPALILLFCIQMFNRFLPGKLPEALLLFRSGENFYGAVFVIMVLVLLTAQALRNSNPALKFACFSAGVGYAAFFYFALIPPHLVRQITPVEFLESRAEMIPAGALVMADDRLAVAAAWALRRTDIAVYRKKSELAYGLDRPEGQGRFYTPEDLADLVKENKQPIVVIVRAAKRLREMPPPSHYESDGAVYLVQYWPEGNTL